MSKITQINARQILDSRGNPTVEVDVHTEKGWGRASVPSGASTGSREAKELRDEKPSFYCGKSVERALDHVRKEIFKALLGVEVTNQQAIDKILIELDGTDNKHRLGANALLGVSLAVARAGAVDTNSFLFRYLWDLGIPNFSKRLKLPTPLMNVINGGAHAANNLDIQEFMLVPHLPKPFKENLRAGVEIFHALKKVLKKEKLSTNVGDEGGFAPPIDNHRKALDYLLIAIESAGYKPGKDVSLSLDVAASEFYDGKHYHFEKNKFTAEDMIIYYKELCDSYPIYSIEDGLAENDYKGWIKLTKQLGDRYTLVGDDLFVTNKIILAEGIKESWANAILIKPNQIGTLSETFDTLDLAFKNNLKAIISHRSGETADSFIADLAVACGSGHIKTGSLSRSDRLEKYNQLLRIEELLGSDAFFEPIQGGAL